MNMQRNRFLYFALAAAALIVAWFVINFLAVKTR